MPRDEVTNCAFGGEDRKTLYITGRRHALQHPHDDAGPGGVAGEQVSGCVVALRLVGLSREVLVDGLGVIFRLLQQLADASRISASGSLTSDGRI